MNRNTTILIAGLAAVIVAVGAIAWAVKSFMGGSAVDQQMAQVRALPVMSQVLADNPEVEAKLRRAAEEDQRNPQAGPQQVFAAVADIRRTIIAPAEAAADDATLLAVMKARAALVSYLQKNDLVACRQFAGEGIQADTKLDDEGQRLFGATLAATEAAYRNGKAKGGKATLLSQQEFNALLQSAGITSADLAKFAHPATLKDADFCALELSIDEAPDKLPEDKRGAFARFVLSH